MGANIEGEHLRHAWSVSDNALVPLEACGFGHKNRRAPGFGRVRQSAGTQGVSGVLAVEIVGESRIEELSPLMCSGVGIGISARAQLRGRGD